LIHTQAKCLVNIQAQFIDKNPNLPNENCGSISPLEGTIRWSKTATRELYLIECPTTSYTPSSIRDQVRITCLTSTLQGGVLLEVLLPPSVGGSIHPRGEANHPSWCYYLGLPMAIWIGTNDKIFRSHLNSRACCILYNISSHFGRWSLVVPRHTRRRCSLTTPET